MKQNYQLTTLNLEDAKDVYKYKKLLSTCSNKNVYYSLEHMLPFDREFGDLKCFLFQTDNGIILMPFIFRSIICEILEEEYFDVISPWGYAGPLLSDHITNDSVIAFWEYVDKWYIDNNIVTEFIRFNLNDNQKFYSGTTINTLSNVKGNLLDNFEDQWATFNQKVRNNYRKAEKHNLTFKLFKKEEISKDEIQIFNKIYVDTMLRNNASKVYFFSDTHFENLILSNPNDFFIGIVYYNNIPISVELIINHNETIYAHLGGTNSEYFKCRPNDFLRVEITRWAIKEKKKFYILGGGIKNNDGLHKSKKAFFPKDEPIFFYTGRKIINKELYDKICLFNNKEKYNNLDKENPESHFFPFYRFS